MRKVVPLHGKGSAGLFGLLLAAVLLLAACGQSVAPTPSPPRQILFIGNSLTFWNLGVDAHLAAMAASDSPPLELKTDSVTVPGAHLAQLWELDDSVEAIRGDDWDAVVLQSDHIGGPGSPMTEEWSVAVRKFDQEIRQGGAETALFMPWILALNATMEDAARSHREMGAELGAKFVPVGLAWQQVAVQQPTLNLYDADGTHPNIRGTFLTTCMHYLALFGPSVHCAHYEPESLVPSPDTAPSKALARDIEHLREAFTIPEEERAFLERIARETIAAQAETVER